MGFMELRRDRAHVKQLFKSFDETHDTGLRARIMDEALTTAEGHRGHRDAITYVLRGTSGSRRWNIANVTVAAVQIVAFPVRLLMSRERESTAMAPTYGASGAQMHQAKQQSVTNVGI